MIIRELHAKDVADLGRVSSDTWQATYRGIVHDEFLSTITFEHQSERWAARAKSDQPRGFVYVAEDETDTAVGFVSAGAVREHRGGPEFVGEIYAIYVHPTAQGLGVGRLLIQAAWQRFLADGVDSAIVWALEENYLARRFYAKMGGVESGRQQIELGERAYPEIGYGWRSLASWTE